MSLISKCGKIIIGRGVLCSKWNTFQRSKLQVRLVSSSFNDKQGIRQNSSNNDSIRKSVFISQSTDVFTNLALEDWLYRNFDFTNHHILLLWRNDPCVVIGRHQNPWLECDTGTTEKHNIALVRRNSGGGTVYHDNGNLNLSFFTTKERYNRRYNLEIITRALYREWGLKAVVNEREDIVVDGRYKVSFDVMYFS
ncbi:hypothetical protein M0802_005605 [Mischocyttarus mexicanus]|nr:hypothetical protein M0802_005605 [Mischocyttarus mexicanus]